MCWTPWSTDLPSGSTDLLPDVLREISGRLHDPADFVRFHAVCQAWRDSKSPGFPISRTNQFLPWLVAPNWIANESIQIRCVFSKTSYRAPPSGHPSNWVGNADGNGVRYFTAGPCSGLHDPLMGAHSLPLPPFPHGWKWKQYPDGIVYRDVAILLFSYKYKGRFWAALLRPGDTTWTLVERDLPTRYGRFCIIYHSGKIMVTMEASGWLIIATNNGVIQDDVLVPRTWLPPEDRDNYFYNHGSYALDTGGELLWLSVEIDLVKYYSKGCSIASALRVVVLALQEVEEGPEKPRWVRKDGRSLADRVLFLGWPNSFAMDASQQLQGGCAYFVYEKRDKDSTRTGHFGVFKYNFIDKKAEFVEWLSKGWNSERCTWLVPEPAISPITEINEKLKPTKWKEQITGLRRMIQMLLAVLAILVVTMVLFA